MPTLALKLAFREDEAAGVVRAYFSTLDDSDRVEVATMSLALLHQTPGLFNSWIAVLQDAFKLAIETATGGIVERFQTYRPHDKN